MWLADSIVNAIIPILNISNVTTREEAIKFINEQPRVITNLRERIRGILDWLQHPTTRKQNLRELSFKEAERKSKEWHSEIQVQGGDINFTEPSENIVLKEYPENDNAVKYYWVYIPQSYCDVESRRMGHCGRTSASSLISLRSIRPYTETDTITDSHVTIAYDENDGYIYQAKGKKNQKPAEKYFPYLFDLVKMLAYNELMDMLIFKNKEQIEKLKIKLIEEEKVLGLIEKIANNDKIDKIIKDVYFKNEAIIHTDNKIESLNDLISDFGRIAIKNNVIVDEEISKYKEELKDKQDNKKMLESELAEKVEEYLKEVKRIIEKNPNVIISEKQLNRITNPLEINSQKRSLNLYVLELKRKIYDDKEIEVGYFKGFNSEYSSSEDYGWQDMTNEEIKELYAINPEIFNDFASKFMLYEAGIIAERPNTIFVISKSAEYVEDLFNVDSNLRDFFVKDVLAGDIYDVIDTSWSYQHYYDEASDYVDELKPNQYEEVLDKIVEITGYEKEDVKENGAKYYLDGDDDEFDKDEFDEIRTAIAKAMENAEADAYQKYYYEQIESALQELGGVKELNDSGVEIEIDLLDTLELNQISSYMKDLDTESLEDVFWEAQSQGEIELPKLSIDDRYSAWADDWQDYFDIDIY